MRLAKPPGQVAAPKGSPAKPGIPTSAQPVQPGVTPKPSATVNQNAGPPFKKDPTASMTGTTSPATAVKAASGSGCPTTTPQSKLDTAAAEILNVARPKKPRKKKPDAAKSCWQIYVGATMDRYNAIQRNAAALGLSASQYLLMCESETASKIIEQFINYIETRYRIDNEMMIERRRIEQDTNPTNKDSL